MKTIQLIGFALLFLGIASCQTKPTSGYNAELAKELGADNYGMKQYVIAFLMTGDNENLTAEEKQDLQRKHMDNIGAMAKSGKLMLAGPFINEGEWRGIYVFDVETIEEAKELTETDPAVQNGVFKMELKRWYGSAALLKVNELHEQIAKENP